MGVTPVEARNYVPDLRVASSFQKNDYRPAFGLSGDSMNRVTPKQFFPSFGNNQGGSSSALTPRFGGVSFSPSSLMSGTGMENLLSGGTSFTPSFGASSGSFGLPSGPTTTLDDVLRQHGIGQYAPSAPTVPGSSGAGAVSNLGDHPLNSYNQYFVSAGAATGVDPLLLKAIAYVEHGWDQPTSPAGAVGIMQLMPNWEGELGVDRMDPAQNILGGAKVLIIKKGEGDGSWEDAVARYHGYGSDGYTTHQQYVAAVFDWYDKLKQAAPPTSGAGGPASNYGGGGLASVFGGNSFGISQGIGQGNNAMDYSYGVGLGVGNNHPGIDIAAPEGTKAYFPRIPNGVWGTVIIAGGSPYFQYDGGNAPGQGELRIQLSNGDIIIYGHMANIAVANGQKIEANTYLGQTGSAGSGAHLHLEYRQKGNCPDGFCAIDPRTVIGY